MRIPEVMHDMLAAYLRTAPLPVDTQLSMLPFQVDCIGNHAHMRKGCMEICVCDVRQR